MSSAKKDRTEEEGPPRWQPTERYPDPAVEVLDPSFARYRIFMQPIRGARAGVHEDAVIDELSTIDHVEDPNEPIRCRPRFNYVEFRLVGRETQTIRAAQVAGDNACLTRFPIDPIDALRQFGGRRVSLVIAGDPEGWIGEPHGSIRLYHHVVG